MPKNSRFFSYILVFLILSIAMVFGSNFNYTVIRSEADVFQVKINFEKPEFLKEQGKVYASYKGAHYFVDSKKAYLPALTKLFNLSSVDAPNIRVLNSKIQSVKVDNYYTIEQTDINKQNILQPAQVKYLGQYKSVPLFALEIFPVRYDQTQKEMNWFQEIELIITASSFSKTTTNQFMQKQIRKNDFLNQVVLNTEQVFQKTEPVTLAKQTSDASTAGFLNTYSDIFKIAINEDGIYKVTFTDLVDVEFPVDKINPLQLRLFNKGQEVPIVFKGADDGTFDEDDYFEFWGQKNEKTFLEQFSDVYADPFSDINIYWLANGIGLGSRLAEESGIVGNTSTIVFSPQSYTEILHFEKDSYHENFGHHTSGLNRPSYELDHWYFDSGISAPEGIAYDFYVPHPYETSMKSVVVTAALRGKSYYSNPTNLLSGHQVDLKLRGKNDVSKRIGLVNPDDRWRDQQMRFISNADSAEKISQSVLENGLNRLEVDMFQTGVTDIVLMNWFEIKYQRKYRAHNNYIKFRVDKDFLNGPYVALGDTILLNIDGFDSKDISLYKLGTSKIVNGKIGNADDDRYGPYAISIWEQVYDPNVKYVALTESAKLKPLTITPYEKWQSGQAGESLMTLSRQIDYLIITHKIFYENALKLREVKIGQGYQTEVVTVENIYDLFNYGVKSPLAIKEFIKYALNNWNQTSPLHYVVFVGKASYDYKGKIKKDADLVPTFMYQTEKYGSSSSDYWYSILDEDDYIPDVCVARIPASTNQELINYIDKVENYGIGEDANGKWINSSLFISGNDAGGGDKEYLTNQPIFRSQNLRLLTAQLPQSQFSSRLNTVKDENIPGYDPSFGSTTDLIQHFDDGLSFINFLGHGGGGIWADVTLLNLTDVDRLNNGYKLPFIASMTCFTGAFENPNRLNLAEKLILSEKKGAIGILAASGVGWKYNDFAIEWDLFDFLWDKNLTFGQAVDLMKIYYLANPVYSTSQGDFYTFGYGSLKYSMVSQYNLLGDPALKMRQADNTMSVQISNLSPAAGDTLDIQFIDTGINSGDGHIMIMDQQNALVYENYFSFTPGYLLKFPVPEEGAGQIYSVKVFVNNSTESSGGSAQIRVERPFIKSITVAPAEPEVNQVLSFTAIAMSHRPISSMELTNFRSYDSPYGSSVRVPMERVNDTLFQSSQAYTGFSSGGLKYFDISARDDSGNVALIRRWPINISDPRPDLSIKTGSLSYTGTDKLQLQFILLNESDSALANIKISCFDAQGLANGQPFAQPITLINAREEKTIVVNYDTSGMAAMRLFQIDVDPDDQISERNEGNNLLQTELATDRFYIDKSIGTSSDGVTNDTISLFNKWDYFVKADALPASAVVQFSEIDLSEFFKSGEQSGLGFVALAGSADSSGIWLSYPQSIQESNANITLSAKIDTAQYTVADLQDIALYRFDSFLNLWIMDKEILSHNGILAANINKSGSYAFFKANDHQVPSIEVTANGRPLIKDMLLTRKPVISFLLEDENGVNFTNSLNVHIDDLPLIVDGKPQVQHEITIPDSLQNAKAIAVTANPQLEPGTHNLIISVADINGNTATPEAIEFTVSGDFFMEVHGNYPNPFSDRTNISYTLTSDIDKFSIKIYTTSGRLIRKKMLPFDETIDPDQDNVTRVDYHELVWDGTDDDGEQVANGVYFMVISGKFQGKTITETLKIARLR